MLPTWLVQQTSYSLIKRLCPPRDQNTHKGDYGRVLILAGSEGFTGAPSLAAKAALRTGAGLIFTGVPRTVYPIVAAKLDAPMVFPLPDENGRLSPDALDVILEKLETADACLLGPGLGRSPGVDTLVLELIRRSPWNALPRRNRQVLTQSSRALPATQWERLAVRKL